MPANPLYRSKIDTWALALLAIVPLIPAVASVLMHTPIASLSFAVVFLLYALLVLPVTYRLGPESLDIRSGVLRWSVPYAEMHAVELSRSPVAAPALSLDRLRIRYGYGRQALISPGNQPAFLADLLVRAPQLPSPLTPP